MMVDFVGVLNKVTAVTSLVFARNHLVLETGGVKEKPQSTNIEDWGFISFRELGGCG